MDAQSFAYLRGDSVSAPGIDDAANYAEVARELAGLITAAGAEGERLVPGGVASVWSCLDGLMHLGNIQFTPSEEEEVGEDGMSRLALARGGGLPAMIEPGEHMRSFEAFQAAAEAWGVSAEALEDALLTFTRAAGGEERLERNSCEQATEARDALAKAVYQHLFTRMIDLANAALAAAAAGVGGGGAESSQRRFVGLLDIFGMEHFDVNGFEQLLINFANERLQQLFINEAVTRVQAEFKFEGVAVDEAAFKDNLEVLELLDGKVSILTVLNSQSVSNTQPDDSRLMRELHNAFGDGKHAEFSVPLTTAATQFTICHFAADVTYTVAAAEGAEGFVSKNKDSLLPKLPLLLRGSKSAFLAHLFPEPPGGWGAPQARPPVAQQFRASVASLTQTLEGTVQHFVRCIKPNETKAAFHFAPQTVRVQLISCSVQAAAEVSRAGWPYRASFFDMLDQFEDLMSPAERKLVFSGSDLARQQLVKKLMSDAGFAPESYAIGRTKVFGSAGLEAELGERAADFKARREAETEAKRHAREAMDAEQLVRMAALEEQAAAAAEAALNAERERTEEAVQQLGELNERARAAEAAAAAEKAAMGARLREQHVAMEAKAAAAAEQGEAREAARVEEMERKRAANEEMQRAAEAKAAAAEARANDAFAKAAAAGEEAAGQMAAARQLGEARGAEAAAAVAKVTAAETACADAEKALLEESQGRREAEMATHVAAAEKAELAEAMEVAALEAKSALAAAQRDGERRAREEAAAAAEAARVQAEAARREAEAYAASRHAQELELEAAQRAREVEAEREEKATAMALARQHLMAAHEEMERVAVAEQAMAKQATQHGGELAALQAQLEEQRQLLHSTQEERDFHRDGKLEMRGELSETKRRAAAELIEQKAAMEQTVAQLALEDAEALTERAQVFLLLGPAIERVERQKSSVFSGMGRSISQTLSFSREKEKRAEDKRRQQEEEREKMARKRKQESEEWWWEVIKEATGGGSIKEVGSVRGSMASVSHELEFVTPTLGADRVDLADACTGQLVGSIALAKPMSGSAEEAISEAAQRWTKELAHLGGMLERVAEHLSWRANQCNLAARAAKDDDDDATDRLRTLQAREFFRGAARMAEGKQAGIHLISANNMTRRLDVTLAIIEYRRLLDDPEMAELVPLLRDAMKKAQAMEVAELQAAKGDEHQAARTDPRGWQMLHSLGPFRLEPINFAAIEFSKEGARYSINLAQELLANLDGKGFASRGYTSPPQVLTMEPHDRRLTNVPLEATHFAWAFPLSGVAEAHDRDAIVARTREEAFALFGGFVYLNENSMVIAVNSFAKASRGLCFDGPFPLNSPPPGSLAHDAAGRPRSVLASGLQLRAVLLSEARANFATVGEQLAMGVKNYAWLGPGEARGMEDGAAWPQGAFVYLYDDSRTDLDCYFTVKESVRTSGGSLGGLRATMYNSSPSPEVRAQHSVSMDYPQKATTFDLGHSPPVVRQTVSSHR